MAQHDDVVAVRQLVVLVVEEPTRGGLNAERRKVPARRLDRRRLGQIGPSANRHGVRPNGRDGVERTA
jgi:hypothetical protein